MKIHITNMEADLREGVMQPTAVSFLVNECGYQFNLRLDENINLYISNRHIHRANRKGNYDLLGINPLKLTLDDLPIFEEVIEHWKEIHPKFVQRIAHGSPWDRHRSTTYIYPDGRQENYLVDDPRKPKMIRGKSIDTKFPSDYCSYIKRIPLEQHYRYGRFDFYLEKAEVAVEDDTTIEVLEDKQPETVLELLRFIAYNPRTYLANLSGNRIKMIESSKIGGELNLNDLI